MRIAAIYDIHGNAPALEAVLQDITQERVDRIVVGGDVVAGPMPRETLGLLQNCKTPMQFICGNADREVIAQMRGEAIGEDVPEHVREVVVWVAQQLEPEHLTLLLRWQKTLQLSVEGLGEVLFCHATPQSDTDIFTRITPESKLLPLFDINASLVVCGHTHMQFDRRVGNVRVVNAGSVGMPYGETGAYWLLLDSGVELKRTSYDLEAAAKRIRATGYPQAEAFASDNVLSTHSEAEVLGIFEPMALGGDKA